MSGELILKNSKRWKQVLPAVLLTALATFFLVWLLMGRRSASTSDILMGIMVVVLAYILFRTLYPALVKLMPGGDKTLHLRWRLTGDALELGEETISLDNIRKVHCWPNRDALGHRLAGWIVNIETVKGKNHVLCSVDEGDGVDESVESLHQLVSALGYESGWVEE